MKKKQIILNTPAILMTLVKHGSLVALLSLSACAEPGDPTQSQESAPEAAEPILTRADFVAHVRARVDAALAQPSAEETLERLAGAGWTELDLDGARVGEVGPDTHVIVPVRKLGGGEPLEVLFTTLATGGFDVHVAPAGDESIARRVRPSDDGPRMAGPAVLTPAYTASSNCWTVYQEYSAGVVVPTPHMIIGYAQISGPTVQVKFTGYGLRNKNNTVTRVLNAAGSTIATWYSPDSIPHDQWYAVGQYQSYRYRITLIFDEPNPDPSCTTTVG